LKQNIKQNDLLKFSYFFRWGDLFYCKGV